MSVNPVGLAVTLLVRLSLLHKSDYKKRSNFLLRLTPDIFIGATASTPRLVDEFRPNPARYRFGLVSQPVNHAAEVDGIESGISFAWLFHRLVLFQVTVANQVRAGLVC
ncbi:hypothetical protein SAMN05216316_0587 [Nitrosovibrio sp. Nv6]|nr:hypothetical protein SAMN05216316_0587 [Nitrosovibrio sp. Nv6]